MSFALACRKPHLLSCANLRCCPGPELTPVDAPPNSLQTALFATLAYRQSSFDRTSNNNAPGCDRAKTWKERGFVTDLIDQSCPSSLLHERERNFFVLYSSALLGLLVIAAESVTDACHTDNPLGACPRWEAFRRGLVLSLR
uniref:Uncharacterized protein n=1 Tax=Molossus molossus TaxID=27622 RepID=A0A7J8FRZ9_MOLMO|nr:hypothetical protein HJG59_008396 [Molossus molossus]